MSVWVQGTAATALAGVYGALKVQGKEAHSLTQQRIVVLGAGSAGMGVSTMMAQGMVKHVSSTLMPPSIGLKQELHYDGTRHGQTCELYSHASCGVKDTLLLDTPLDDLKQK